MRTITTKSNAFLFSFESMTDVVSYVDPKQYDKNTKSKDFVGEDLPTWDDVNGRTVKEWTEGMEILQMYLEKLEAEQLPEIKSHKRKVVWSFEEGDEMDLERMMQGLPYWKKYVREATTGPTTVTIVTDTTTEAFRDSDDILWRGAAAVALAKVLEAKGYSVELWVVNGSTLFANRPTQPVFTACCLKRPTDPLDVSTLINTVAGWFYRTVTFTMLRTICERCNERIRDDLGYAHSPSQADLDEITMEEPRIYSSGVYTFSGALSVLKNELQRIAEQFPPNDDE